MQLNRFLFGTLHNLNWRMNVMAFRYLFYTLLVVLVLFLPAVGRAAADSLPESRETGQRMDTPSGFPVPRFLSLKYDKTYCRQGPTFSHDVRFTYMKRGSPVLVVAETIDHWRKIRDQNGDECWMHKSTLRAQSHILLKGEVELFARPKTTSHPRGVLGAGVLARLDKQKNGWHRLSVGSIKGWGQPDNVWGGDPVAASRN